MRHFNRTAKQERRRLSLWVNKEMNSLLEKYLVEHGREIRKQYLEVGVREDELDEKIEDLRTKLQIDMIKRFKVELKAVREEKRDQQANGKRTRAAGSQKDSGEGATEKRRKGQPRP